MKHMSLMLKKELEYKISFILSFISQIGIFFSYYFMTIALFQKFNNIKGFNVYEVLLCFSIINFGFSFNEIFFRGVDKFEKLIIDGSLDRLLLRPRNVLFQVMCNEMDFIKVARILQSLIVFFIAISNLSINLNLTNILLIIAMFISSIILFFGLFLLMASYCFITVHGLEVKNVLTDGGKNMAQYPIGIFKKGFIFIFSFIIPYASVNYYPLLYLLGKSNNILYLFSPILVIIYLIPCIIAFNIGLKHYTSTGS